MITPKPYQEDAVEQLLSHFYRIALAQQVQGLLPRHERIVFKAPTGAGKTVTMAGFLHRLLQELPLRLDLPCRQFAFLWMAPNRLHQQSLFAMRSYFESTRTIACLAYDDITNDRLRHGDVLFLNWPSVWSADRILMSDGETGRSLPDLIRRTRGADTELVVVVDEAGTNLNAPKCQGFLERMDPCLVIEVSATPQFASDYHVEIPRIQVVQAGMIKKSVILNPRLDPVEGVTLNELLLREALKKRNALERAYARQGSSVRPLLLVQLPNDSKERETDHDREIHASMVASLKVKGITTANGKLAVWLSGEKANQTDEVLRPFQSTVEVLLFKQAIALGWDCPRAAVLLAFRELKESSFTVQTVGRILRMPEQRHYADDTLNHGYVFTDLARDAIRIDASAKDTITFDEAHRVPGYEPMELPKQHLKTWGNRMVLGYRFRSALVQAALESGWQDPTEFPDAVAYNISLLRNHLVQTEPGNLRVEIPRDAVLDHSVYSGGTVLIQSRARIARTDDELRKIFDRYCAHSCVPYEVFRSTGKLKLALLQLLERFLATPESSAYSLILFAQNQPYWNQLLERAKQIFEAWTQEQKQRKRLLETFPWDVPESRAYFSDQSTPAMAPHHVLQGYFVHKEASQPELAFAESLERHGKYLRWWYKNGDSGTEHFSVVYRTTDGLDRLFFPDFIVLFTGGTLGFFDTKTARSDADAPAKHNALRHYLDELAKKTGKYYLGGIVMEFPEHSSVWHLHRGLLKDTRDPGSWEILNLKQID